MTIPIGSGQYTPAGTLIEYINGTSNFYANGLSSTNGQLPSNFLTARVKIIAVENDPADAEIIRGCERLSESVFQKIWDNPLDADYDKL